MRLLHLKLLLQDGPKHSTDESIGAQFTWNHELTDDNAVFKSFLCSIVGRDFITRRKTLESILENCDNWLQENWKYLLLLLRMVVDINEYAHFNGDQRNELKKMTKS